MPVHHLGRVVWNTFLLPYVRTIRSQIRGHIVETERVTVALLFARALRLCDSVLRIPWNECAVCGGWRVASK